ncbi:hypothetical protein D5366_04275 [Neokomagataea tanensis]|uniref:Hedgehog/Intein (Hint) domain-containing protein n=2 Tax=Neokomagataea TaxID=1223423 RepID=A0A4Y6V703_9PROT|nr:hypothetical protein D5366_04275 [Neokomagataea tanensis]
MVANTGALSGQIVSSGTTITTPTGETVQTDTPLLEILSGGTVLNTLSVPYTTTPFQFHTASDGGVDLLTNFSLQSTPTYTNPVTGAIYALTSGSVVSGSVVNPPLLMPFETPPVIAGSQTISSGSAVSGSIISGASKEFYTNTPGVPTIAVPASQTVEAGGAALNTVISGAAFDTGLGMATATYYTTASASQVIESGGYASGTTIGLAASSVIESGAISENVAITGAIVPAGKYFDNQYASLAGTQIVSSGGVLNTATITSGGTLNIDGGTANNITTLSGYILQDSRYPNIGSTALATIIDNGGTLTNVSLISGTQLLVGSNTTVTNLTAMSGASISLNQNANILGNVNIDPRATILLQGAGATLSGISGTIVTQSTQFSTLFAASKVTSQAQNSGAVLNVLSNGTVINEIALPSATTPFSFQQAPSGSGVDLVIGTPCFCPGTHIMTPDGERLVEDLAIGDLVLTAGGKSRKIHWIGTRSYDPIFAFGNRDILPVKFTAGSLGDGLPKRDLTVSPLHAMFIDGYLVPALHLINDHTVVQIKNPKDIIAYIHIELETHDILLAEGSPTESFLDDGSRNMFHNAQSYEELYPNRPKTAALYCAPRLEGGTELARIQEKLFSLASSSRHRTA